jgi:cystathionine beta-synthase
MMERGFLDVKTLKDIVSGRSSKQKLISVEPGQLVSEAVELMKKYDIEHIPVLKDHEPVGSISENGLFQKMFSNPDIRSSTIGAVLENPFPIVDFNTAVERVSSLISKENGAVLGRDDSGHYHIVTKYDILQALAK